MACNSCETSFQGAQNLVVTITKQGTTALLYVQNQGRNIIQIRRIVLCSASPGGGSSLLYLRPPPDPISWTYPSAFIEPGLGALYYTWNNIPAGAVVQAQAEYIELEGRSRSCPANF
jgi:hypothetical protein